MNCCIYLRKSRTDLEAEAHGEGETLARHERALMDYAKKHKLNMSKIYKEVVSGETITARPVMQQLLSDVEKGIWAGVLVMEVERLARGDTIDQGLVAQTFKYSGTKIITPMKVYDPSNEFDEEYFEFGLFMSRREYKTINRRLQAGRIQSVKEGKWVCNKSPYGYKRVKLQGQKGYTLEVVPDEAAIIRMIFELYTIGEEQPDGAIKRLGSSLISNKLNDMKIPSATGIKWIPSRVLDLMRNPVYVGKVRWNNRPEVKKMQDGVITKERPRSDEEAVLLFEGLHEAIVDEDLFYKTQCYLKDHQPKPAPNKKPIKNPLSSFVICGQCGAKMVRRPYPNRTPDALICPTSGCKNISSYLSNVESKILELLQQWIKEYKIQLSLDNKEKVSNNEVVVKRQNVKRLEDEIKGLIKQMDSIYNFFEQGIYSTETFMERSKSINEKLKEANIDLKIIINELEKDPAAQNNIINFIPKVEHVLTVYDLVDDPEVKNALLGEMVSKVVYTKNKRVGKDKIFDDFELIIFPKIPK